MVAGAVLLQAAFTIDCVDGQLARYTRTFSKLGAWLDSVFDRGKEYLVFAGLAIGATRGFGQDVWVLAAAALALQTARHTLDFTFALGQRGMVDATTHMPLEHAADAPVRAGVPADPEDAEAGEEAAAAARAGPRRAADAQAADRAHGARRACACSAGSTARARAAGRSASSSCRSASASRSSRSPRRCSARG